VKELSKIKEEKLKYNENKWKFLEKEMYGRR
jgi:hypothetical protein